MPSLRTFLLASIAVATAAAQCDSDITIESDGDTSQLDGCDTYEGNISCGPNLVNLTIPDVQVLRGDFDCRDAAALTAISAPSMRSISGQFLMEGLTVLQTLSFPQLNEAGSISWTALPALRALEFTSEVTKCSEVLITNTKLNSLDGINLQTANIFNINNNFDLKKVDVALGNVSQALSIEFNAKNVEVSLPNLVWAQNITIRDAGSVSFPNLETVNKTLAFVNNTFTECSFPKLTEVGGSFAFNSNSKLSNISAVHLETVGGTFQLANNTKLSNIDGFPAVSIVEGSVDISGSFKNATLPSLEEVSGGFNAQSTEDFDCTKEFNDYEGSVVKGTFKCAGKLDEAKSANGGASTTGSGSNGDDDSTGSASRAGISIVALLAAGVAMFAL